MINLRTDLEERKVIATLDEAVRQESVARLLDKIAKRLDRKLEDAPQALMLWEVMPLGAYGTKLPDVILSSWIFNLRANVATGAEYHPNSQQRMMSYRGEGDFLVWHEGGWQSNYLKSDPGAPLEDRWLSIPINTWHQSMKPKENWIIVSFHSAKEEELMEVRGDPANPVSLDSRRYLEMKH